MPEHGLSHYLKAAKNHSSNYKIELDELKSDLLHDNFSSRDYRATERLLQVYVELCIGLAKHWVKQTNQTTTTDAYQAFSLLKEDNKIKSRESSIRYSAVFKIVKTDKEERRMKIIKAKKLLLIFNLKENFDENK